MIQQRILVLAPHTDDAELGCGATIARFIEEGAEVYIAVFSTAEESLPKGAPPGTLKRELFASMEIMGVPRQRLRIYNYAVRKLSYHRQEVLEELVRLKSDIRPSLVLLPASSDLHQDHQVVYMEGLRAFKDMSIWGYELPWNHIQFSANTFVVVTRKHLELKWKALTAYETQLRLKRPYFSWNFIEGLAKVRGLQIKVEFAEAYELLRMKLDLAFGN